MLSDYLSLLPRPVEIYEIFENLYSSPCERCFFITCLNVTWLFLVFPHYLGLALMGSSLVLRDVNNSCTLVFPCFHLLWFRLSSPFFGFISNSGFKVGNDGFGSSYFDKSTITIVHRCNLLPLMLRNCIISPKSFCFKCGLWENCQKMRSP